MKINNFLSYIVSLYVKQSSFNLSHKLKIISFKIALWQQLLFFMSEITENDNKTKEYISLKLKLFKVILFY